MDKDFNKILELAKSDENVLGLVLFGSRGKGFENEYSDYDMTIVSNDEMLDTIKKTFENKKWENVDLNVKSLTEFREYAKFGSEDEWDRYDYAHAKVLVDKHNDLKKIISEKGTIPVDKQKKLVGNSLDAYVNGVFRSVKAIRNKNQIGAHLEAVNSILDLLTLLFALEGRHKPFYAYVKKELETYPLKLLPWPVSEFVGLMEKVLTTADLESQQTLLIGVDKLCRNQGCGDILDAWEDKDKWAMTWKPE